jgi:hypothetical protein
MGKKVRCIDAKGFAQLYLEEGRIYEVDDTRTSAQSGDYVLVGVNAGGFMRKRFIDVVDDMHTKPTPKVFPKVDAPEWKVWKNAGRDPKHCDCGISKIDCDYHK